MSNSVRLVEGDVSLTERDALKHLNPSMLTISRVNNGDVVL
jgi:hypothetical protein